MYKYTDKNKEHLHELDGKPLIGTSRVTGVIAKPLTWWASGKAVAKLGWLNPKFTDAKKRLESAADALEEIIQMSPDVYLGRLDEAYRAHKDSLDESAEGGTDLHFELENYVKGCIEQYKGYPQAKGGNLLKDVDARVGLFTEWAVKNIDKFLWSEIHCYSENMWVGGISDCGFIDKQGKVGIIDFKSSREAYISHFIQIAGYDLQISENGGFDADGKKILEPIKADYYAVWPFGGDVKEPATNYDTESLREAFEAALKIYKLINN